MARYITPDTIQSGNLFIPADTKNADYRALLASGVTITPWAEPTAAELLALERAGMVLTRLQFALRALIDEVMTAAETEAFLGPRTIPAIGEAALLLIQDAGQRTIGRMRFVGFERLERTDDLVAPFQAAVNWTPERVDEFFSAAALL
jgi:hypothetical protein